MRYGRRSSKANYYSDIRNKDDFEKALSILKRLHAIWSSSDRKQPPDTTSAPYYSANTSYIDQLYDTIRARLLDEFPGAEEIKTDHYHGFRYPDGIYFCTITKQKYKIWFGYSGRHAELNLEPDGFVQEVKGRSGDEYNSEIRNVGDFEKALSILKRLHALGSDGDRKQPSDTAPAPYRRASIPQMDQLYDAIRARLLDEFPGAEETKTKHYNGFRYPDCRYFCTIAKQKSNMWFSYSGKRAESKLEPDGFVQDVQRWSGDRYHSEIRNMDDFEKALSILKRLHALGSDGDRKQPPGVAFDPDYADNTIQLDQLYDAIRARLLDEFPGAEENKIEYYSGFRYPGDTYFSTVTMQKSKIRFVYSGKRAASKLNPDGFVKVGKGWGAGIYYSDIRNKDDFEKALSILIQIHPI